MSARRRPGRGRSLPAPSPAARAESVDAASPARCAPDRPIGGVAGVDHAPPVDHQVVERAVGRSLHPRQLSAAAQVEAEQDRPAELGLGPRPGDRPPLPTGAGAPGRCAGPGPARLPRLRDLREVPGLPAGVDPHDLALGAAHEDRPVRGIEGHALGIEVGFPHRERRPAPGQGRMGAADSREQVAEGRVVLPAAEGADLPGSSPPGRRAMACSRPMASVRAPSRARRTARLSSARASSGFRASIRSRWSAVGFPAGRSTGGASGGRTRSPCRTSRRSTGRPPAGTIHGG